MKFLILIIVALLVFFGGFFLFYQRSSNEKPVSIETQPITAPNKNMIISSSAFSHNGSIPRKYTCDGENINPPLSIADTPEEAKSLALIVDDPDAPMGTWVHWTVFNIDPSITEVPENSKPKNGVEAMTDFKKPGYGGPCPPSGIHRYFFKLYALDIELKLSPSATKKDIEKAMTGHILARVELIGLYQRSK